MVPRIRRYLDNNALVLRRIRRKGQLDVRVSIDWVGGSAVASLFAPDLDVHHKTHNSRRLLVVKPVLIVARREHGS
jgi:hypothetical protein